MYFFQAIVSTNASMFWPKYINSQCFSILYWIIVWSHVSWEKVSSHLCFIYTFYLLYKSADVKYLSISCLIIIVLKILAFVLCLLQYLLLNRGSREDMGAIASPVDNVSQPMGGHHTTLMEDPDVWRPT